MTDRQEQELRNTLARLRDAVVVPPADPARERALLAAFDAHVGQPALPPSRFSPWRWATAAALVSVAVTMNVFVARHQTLLETRKRSESAVELPGFVPWPGADAYPRFESGSLVRVELPVTALPALGLTAPPSSTTVVPAEIVVGQDGLARAVRLVR